MYGGVGFTLDQPPRANAGAYLLMKNVRTPRFFAPTLTATLHGLITSGVILMSSHAAATNTSPTAPTAAPPPLQAPAPLPSDAEGFYFLEGNWRVANKRLKEPLSGKAEWTTFDSRARFITLLDGLVSVEELRDANGQPFGGAMRTFDRNKRTWSDAWVAARDGVLQLPWHGKFDNGVGLWQAEQEWKGETVLARGMWKRVSRNEVHWEQAMSRDQGKTWETNWKMVFTRVDSHGNPVQ
jgi:hypothetical protein